jgi:L-seryl-tRNA(Ser) seleniumtransferase
MNATRSYQFNETINAAGTMTTLGASSVPAEIIEAVADVLPRFVNMVELQQQACRVIQRVIGAEAGCITACAAAGITVGVAACMTGTNMAKVEQLPDTSGLKNEVIIQRGHAVWFSGSVLQMVRLSGAKAKEIGDATRVGLYQLEEAITENTTAALYVVSHHTVQHGLIALEEFCRVAHAHGVPVIVDAASESNMPSFLDRGADLVCFSGHKFLAGPTSGIIAGRKDLVEAFLFHQYHGIGRAMKVGKESIVGGMAALERWKHLDHKAVQREEKRIAAQFVEGLKDVTGLMVSMEPDPTGNPINRVKVVVAQDALGLTAFEIVAELAANDPPIAVRDQEAIDHGFFELDPCNITTKEQVGIVVQAIQRIAGLSGREKKAIRERSPRWPNEADRLVKTLKGWVPS